MRGRIAIAPLLALLVLLCASAASGEIAQKGDLRITFTGGFTPHALPRERPAPIVVSIRGSIATTDGSHPPAVREIEVALNRNGRLSSQGLATCDAGLLQATTSAIALRRCRSAVVGSGRFAATLAGSEGDIPVHGPVLAFNGHSAGRTALLLHFSATTPVHATLVVPLRISHSASGRFGTLLKAQIPTLAGGVGSITELQLKIGREYSYLGERRSFLSAACAAPPGFPGAVFTFARGSFKFDDGRQIGTTLGGDCRVRQPGS